MRAHDASEVELIVNFIHGETVTVLDRAVTEGKADYPAELHRMYRNYDLWQYNGVELPQTCHGLTMTLAAELASVGEVAGRGGWGGGTHWKLRCRPVLRTELFQCGMERLRLLMDNLPPVDDAPVFLVVYGAIMWYVRPDGENDRWGLARRRPAVEARGEHFDV